MAEFQSKFTGQEVENAIDKLRNWVAVDGTYPTVTISGVTYAVIWKIIPTPGTPCYGIGLHPTTGRLYEIYYSGSSYTATALDADTKNTAGAIDNNTDKLYLVGAKNQGESAQTYSNSKVYTQKGKLYSNNTEVSVVGHTHSFDAITNRGEAFLSWGGKNFSGSYGPIDAAMVPELGANRLAFMPANAVTIEYSRDGGSTWTDYGPTDSQKINLFNGLGSSFTIGKATSGAGNIATNKYQLRVNIYTSAGRVYTALNKFVIYLSTSGTNNNWCTIRARKQSDYTADNDTWTTFADKISVSGWSGYNVINTSSITTYGNTASTQYGHIQFIFGCDTGSTNNSYAGLNINKIFGFGGVGWTIPSTMAKTGHMYTYDSSQNVTFPAGVSAVSFTEGGTSLAAKYLGKTAKAADADKLDGNDSTYYLNYNNLTNKPTLGTAASKNTGTSSGNIPILDSNGKLADSVIPAVAITDTYVVATEAAMLALDAQKGDVAIRSDLNKSFVLQATPASTLANWKELLTPTDAVLSVNGKTGAVTLNLDDIGDGSTRKLANYVLKSTLTTKGDIIYASAANTPARLEIGSNGQFLSVDNGAPKWVSSTDETVKLSADVWTDKTIGYINGTSTSPKKVASAGDTLKTMFTNIFGTITDDTSNLVTNPHFNSISIGNSSYEYGTKLNSVSVNVSPVAGSYKYGPSNTGSTWNGNYTFSGTGFTTKADSTANTQTVQLSSQFTVGISSALTLTVSRAYTAGTVTAKSKMGADTAQKIEAGTATKSSTFNPAAKKYVYWATSTSTTTPTTWTKYGSGQTSITDLQLSCNAGEYIWVATTTNATSFYAWNDASGKYNTDKLATTKLSSQTITNSQNASVPGYYIYRTTNKMLQAVDTKFKLE